MDLIKQTKEAFRRAVDRAGGKLARYQEKTGVNYSIINRLNSGKNDFKNVPLQTLIKLFPEIMIYFFRDEYPSGASARPDLTTAERKVLKIMRELDEDGQLDLLAEAGAIRGQHLKNVRERGSGKISKAG